MQRNGKYAKRIFWLDVARVVAIILVVFAHCHEILNFILFTQVPIPSVDVWKASLCYSFSRVGVPLFFMISGALILKRQLANTSNCHIKRILMFVILGVVYSIMCNAIWDYYNTGNLINALWGAIKKYNFILTNDLGIFNQLCFFRGIIPLYLAAPFIALWLKEDNMGDVKKYILITVIIILLPSIFHKHFLLNTLFPSIFAVFPLYFILGFFISENKILQYMQRKYILGLVLFVCSTILSISIDSYKGVLIPEIHEYLTSPFVFINSVAVIMIIKNIFTTKQFQLNGYFKKIVNIISNYSMGIFLIHTLFLVFFRSMLNGDLFSRTLYIIMLFVLTFMASMVYTYIMKQSKWTKWLVS